MPYFLSYVVTRGYGARTEKFLTGMDLENKSPIGHACVAITEVTPGNPPVIICRVGLFATSQILLEDFIVNKTNRQFFHKTYPICENELVRLFVKINRDRNTIIEGVNDGSQKALSEKMDGKKPGGPQFNWLTNNCKSNAINLLKEAGIIDPSITDNFIDIPMIKDLEPLEFQPIGDGPLLEWTNSFKITPRSNYSEFTNNELNELKNNFPDLNITQDSPEPPL